MKEISAMRLFLRVIVPVCCIVAGGCNSNATQQNNAPKNDSRPNAADVDTAALLDLIKKKQDQQPEGTTREDRMKDLARIQHAIVDAAEQIARGKPDGETATEALTAELEALSVLKRTGDEEAADKLAALARILRNDHRPAIADFLKLEAITQKMEKLDAKDIKTVNRLVDDFKDYLFSARPGMQMATVGNGIMNLLINTGRIDEGAELGRVLAGKLAGSDDQAVREAAATIANSAGQMMQYLGQEKEAAEFYSRTVKQLLDRDAELKEAVEPLEREIRKLALIGQPMAISGKLVGGEEFDLAEWKGKVVLVDFWATWCGPCLRELPNVKQVYDDYHDRGFEVVGISLDSDAGDLKAFLKEEHLHWPVLFETDPDQSGWHNPLAKKYGVEAIPWTALIDRQGKVVTLSARGERLGKIVAELVESATVE